MANADTSWAGWRVAAGIALAVAFAAAWTWPIQRAYASPLRHEVYVWQRQWDDHLRDALHDSRDLFTGLRVLALQFDPSGRWIEPGVDVNALAGDGRDVVLVLRIDGSTPTLAASAIGDRLMPLLQRWQAAGVRVRGIEIDHDCATARLTQYAQQLQALRARVPRTLQLSITALPDWREAAALEAVLAAVDVSVLQVHAVQDPTTGLFDATQAQAWIARWAQRCAARPFLVAVPAYGVKLKLDEDGELLAVESEQVLARRSAQSREVHVDPRAVAALVAHLESVGHPNLAGLLWFRLPRDRDQRAWSLQTLRAVITRQALQAQLVAELQADPGGALDVVLRSRGTLDAPLPRYLQVVGACELGDGINGYTLNRSAVAMRFDRTGPGVLRAGRQHTIGWLRCSRTTGVHVDVVDD